MIISCKLAEKIRMQRAKRNLTKTQLANSLGIARSTLQRIEAGNYKAPKRIYQAVMNWLIEDL